MSQRKKSFPKPSAVRHTEILNIVRDEKGKIEALRVAVAFYQWEGHAPGCGQLAFRCPFCRTIHYHHAGEPVFGIRNGLHYPHCHDPIFGIQSVALHKQLARGWFFDFVEVRDFRRAGAFPRDMHKALKQYANTRRAMGEV
jgi:hypothetical protein